MRKPLHWKDVGDENNAILSTVSILKIGIVFQSKNAKLTEEEIESLLWGYWEENKKELRPHIYSMWNMGKKIIEKVIKNVKKKRLHNK